MSIYGRFYFRPSKGEQIHTEIRPAPDGFSAILGAVRGLDGEPVENAITLLFRVPEKGEPEFIAQFATDEEGHFFFGPLPGEELYLVKVFKSTLNMRELEIPGD
ncbi:MAG: hypothetical protein AB7D36_05920 [Oscillospiraceae bacterium]